MAPMEDFASAALRHIRDAENLLEPGPFSSRDQAWHLAGFAHECARKSCLRDPWLPKLLGHSFASASEVIVALAVDLDPGASRLPLRNWTTRFPSVTGWSPEHRYERTGAADGRDVQALVESGRRAVDETTLALWLDGRLTGGSLGC